MSARNIFEALDQNKYDVQLIGITKDGQWLLSNNNKTLTGEAVVAEGLLPVSLNHSGDRTLLPHTGILDQIEQLKPLDVVFPILHGPFGEDGTVQGLLELAGVAYVGAGVTGSSVGMDKIVANRVFSAIGIPQAKFEWFYTTEWYSSPQEILQRLTANLPFPMFVKPVNLGSSVGIRKVNDEETLISSINEASGYDLKVIVEEGLENCHEVEVSVLGNENPKASVVGEIVPGGEFYDYKDKYVDGKAQLLIPANISESAAMKVRGYAIEAFKAIDCAGLARVDFFVEKNTDNVYINEINTIPGFTNISMYPKLWEATGIGYAELIDQLIELAMERRSRKDKVQITL